MTVTRLTPVATLTERTVESAGERVRRLQAEARQLAAEQVEALAHDLTQLGAAAAEIASGGEAYPAGVRELSSRMAHDLVDKAQAMLVLLNRNRGAMA